MRDTSRVARSCAISAMLGAASAWAQVPTSGRQITSDTARHASQCSATALLDSLRRCPLVDASMIALVADPERFHGQRIRTIGFVHLEFEGQRICPYELDVRHRLGNCLWLGVTINTIPKGMDINDKYVFVEGTLNARDHGHLGLFIASIESITRVAVWSSPKRPRRGRP